MRAEWTRQRIKEGFLYRITPPNIIETQVSIAERIWPYVPDGMEIDLTAQIPAPIHHIGTTITIDKGENHGQQIDK
jgi:hypothetical protein